MGLVLGLALAGGLAGCGSIEPVTPFAPVTDPTQLYMALTLDHPAVVLSTVAPYDTLRLTATPRDALGHPMAGLPAPTFASSDTANVQVSADGVLRARGPVSGVWVVAKVQQGSVSHVDTATITVTTSASPPKLASLSIQPVPPDSAVLFQPSNTGWTAILLHFSGIYSVFHNLAPSAVDSAGNVVSEDLSYAYTSLDSAIIGVNHWSGAISPYRPGRGRLVAQTTAYGVTRADTVIYTVRLPLGVDISLGDIPGHPGFFVDNSGTLPPIQSIHVVPHGIIAWKNLLPEDVDVTFDDPTNVAPPDGALCDLWIALGSSSCDGGNMVVPATDDPDAFPPVSQIRQFPVPGIYTFHSARLGASAQIIVGN